MTERRSKGGVFRPNAASGQRVRLTDWPRQVALLDTTIRHRFDTATIDTIDTLTPKPFGDKFLRYTRFASGAVGR
jgi:hypothetical protein